MALYACNKEDNKPAGADTAGEVVRFTGQSGGTVITDLHTARLGQWWISKPGMAGGGYFTTAYYAYSKDSLNMLAVVLPSVPTASREYPLDSSTYVMYYRYLKGGGGSFQGPSDWGLIGQKIAVQVQPSGQLRFSLNRLPATNYERMRADSASGIAEYINGHFTVE